MKKILIVGAGIAGLYLANLLEKNGNYKYRILEKRNNISLKNGYGIQLSINGIKLLNKIGFKEVSVHDVHYPRKVNFFDAKNSDLITEIDISKYNFQGNYYTTLKRSVLINFLLKGIPKDKIQFNSTIDKIEETDKIKINYNDRVENIDFLIICDGVFSKTKNLILNNNHKIKFYNSIALRGLLKKSTNRDISIYLGSNFHFVTYPLNQNNEINFISIIREKNLHHIGKGNDDKLKENYLNMLSLRSNYNFEDNLSDTSMYPIFVSNNICVPKNKNIFISGDALCAFPPSFAQGASQSLESSFEIFRNLEEERDNYYTIRNKVIKKIKFRSELNHFAFHVSNPMIKFLRNLLLKYLSKNNKFLDNYLGKIYR